MTGPRRILTVRARLTLWNVSIMLLVLAVYAAGVYLFVQRSQSLALDERVRSDFSWASEMWEQRPDGSFAWFEGEMGHQDSPWLTVWHPDGHPLYRTTFAAWHPIEASPRLAAEGLWAHRDRAGGPALYRVLSRPLRLAGQPVVIQVARSEAPMQPRTRATGARSRARLAPGHARGRCRRILDGPPCAGARGAHGERARSITADRLSERLPVDNPRDEFGRLASVFNDTLGRSRRRIRADAAVHVRCVARTTDTADRDPHGGRGRSPRTARRARVPGNHRQHAGGSGSAGVPRDEAPDLVPHRQRSGQAVVGDD